MDSDTRDNWAYLSWDGVQRKGEELTEQVFQQSYGVDDGIKTGRLVSGYTN